jgi:hypothetical protein
MTSSLVRYKQRADTTRIILHDSHTTPDIRSGEEVPRWKALAKDGALRMGLLGIGYHFIIERDGTVALGREVDQIGTHTPGHNLDSIGICLVGGRTDRETASDNFEARQWRALFATICALKGRYGDLDVLGHSEVQRYRNRCLPDCPPVDMDDVRQELSIYEHTRRLRNDGTQ